MTQVSQVDSAFFSPLDVEEVLESMAEVEEAAVWGSTDSRGGNDLVNVALEVKKGSLISREEVVAKVAASLHPRKQITGQVNHKSQESSIVLDLASLFRLGESKTNSNCSGCFPGQNSAQPTGEEASAPVEREILWTMTHLNFGKTIYRSSTSGG